MPTRRPPSCLPAQRFSTVQLLQLFTQPTLMLRDTAYLRSCRALSSCLGWASPQPPVHAIATRADIQTVRKGGAPVFNIQPLGKADKFKAVPECMNTHVKLGIKSCFAQCDYTKQST